MSTFDISAYSQADFEATYSPEDDKLRIYASVRIDSDDWQAMKASGWRWAPKQDLFFAKWSVDNEDFCAALAGEIMPEETTMAERAELKAERLINLAEKRATQSFGYQAAAHRISERFEAGQPILIGHHSQRKAERDKKAMERNMNKAVETSQAVNYWTYRAAGVLHHADHKNNSRTVQNRIKTLLTDLRTEQRAINDASHDLNSYDVIRDMDNPESQKKALLIVLGKYFWKYNDLKQNVADNKISVSDALDKATRDAEKIVNGPKRARLICHLLNRLAYEQSNLATVFKFEGALTDAVIQTFLRTHGADKPKATKNEDGSFTAVSSVPFPLHLGDGDVITLSDDEWRELMQAVGYEVPAKRKLPPIINFKAVKPLEIKRLYQSGTEQLEQVEMTKAEYKALHSGMTTTRLSACGQFRFKSARIKRDGATASWDSVERAVFLTDSKAHALPESQQAPALEAV